MHDAPHLPVGNLPLLRALDEHGAGALSLITEEEAFLLAETVKSYRFTKRDGVYGPRAVLQRMSACEEEDIPEDSIVRSLSQRLERQFDEGLEFLCAWGDAAYPFATRLTFNDHLILWYPEAPVGLGAHRDHSKYKNLIVSITLAGESHFNIHDDPDASPRTTFIVRPGSAIVMAAPGFRGKDVRPYHSVTKVSQERIALILKQKEK